MREYYFDGMEDDQQSFNNGEDLRVVSYCPVCNRRYNHLQAKIVDEREGAQLIYIKCRSCLSSVLALVMANQGGISSMGLITDLDHSEVGKFKQSVAISSDDVLEAHDALAGNSIWNLL